jgi:hypothetical protein
MCIVFGIYDGMTALDFASVCDPVKRLRTMGLMPGMCQERADAHEKRPQT